MIRKAMEILLLALCLSFSTIALAETVVLKSGKMVEGKIVEKTDKYIKVDFYGVILAYSTDEIERVDGESKAILPATEHIADKQSTTVKENNIPEATPKEDQAFILKVNESYYNLKREGLLELACEVKSSIFDQAKAALNTQYSLTSEESKILDSMKFYFNIDQEGRFAFDFTQYIPTGNTQFDKDLQLAIGSTENILRGFYQAWSEYVIYPKFKKSNIIYAAEELPDGYNISYREGQSPLDKKMSLDSHFRIYQETISNKGDIINKISPHFTDSKQGLLLNGYDMDMENGSLKLIVTIEYQEAKGLQVPKEVLVQYTHSGVTQNVELRFLDFKLKKSREHQA